MSREKFTDLDISEYLDNDEMIVSLLRDALKSGDNKYFYSVLGHAVKAKGVTSIAKKAGLTREGLYKSLSDEGNPRFDTISKVLHALGVELDFKIAS